MHAYAEEASKRLTAAGFQKLSERAPWRSLKRGGKYYFTRNASTIVAFAVGGRYEAGNGFNMIGAHTDRCACHAPILHAACIMQGPLRTSSFARMLEGRKSSSGSCGA